MNKTRMNEGALEAKKLLDELGCHSPGDMSMEEIAWSCGLMVTTKDMDGSEGRILMNKDSAIISLNSTIRYQPKINYILAHEIGHARMHRELEFFADTDVSLAEWLACGQHETSANQFAAELLMPSDPFSRKVKSKKLSLQLIDEVSAYFGASKTATFLRYRDLGDFPVMIIFIEHGIIKWKSHSLDFPFKWISLKSKVPVFSVAGDYYHKGNVETKPVKIDVLEWFPEDFTALKQPTQKLWEQCFPSGKDDIVTCIWTS